MKEIAILSFDELSKEAQIKVIKANHKHVIHAVREYITEIWYDYIDELSDVLTPGLSVLFTADNCKLDITFKGINVIEPDAIWLTEGLAAQGLINEAINKLKENNAWFADDVEEFNKENELKEPFIYWCYKLYTKLITDMHYHYIKMMSDPEYVVKYIKGEVPTVYIAPDTIFADWEFTVDGKVFSYGSDD